MKNMIALVCLVVSATAHAESVVTKDMRTDFYKTVTQSMRNGELKTENKINPYETGTKIIYEDDKGICLKISIKKIGSMKLPQIVMVNDEKGGLRQTTVEVEAPVLQTDSTPIQCPMINGMLVPTSN